MNAFLSLHVSAHFAPGPLLHNNDIIMKVLCIDNTCILKGRQDSDMIAFNDFYIIHYDTQVCSQLVSLWIKNIIIKDYVRHCLVLIEDVLNMPFTDYM